MKYGLMYYKKTDNIGDDIQTYVAMKYLPHIDYYIDREDLSCFVPHNKEFVSMIMNGWFIHNKLAWPPSPYINPLLISMHFKEHKDTDVGDLYLKSYGGEYLKKFEPVGARDEETIKRLQKNGIESYFSGCMTLTLNKFKGIRKQNKISLIDIEDEIIEKVKKSAEKETKIEILTHYINQKETAKKDIKTRMKDVESLLRKYQSSKLIITTRLHAALPALSLQTPVILIHKKVFDEDRLKTYFKFFVNYVDEDFFKKDIRNELKKPILNNINNSEFFEIRNSINKKCKKYIKDCEKLQFDNNFLPDIEKYKEYVNRLKWYKEIYEKERLVVEKIYNRDGPF